MLSHPRQSNIKLPWSLLTAIAGGLFFIHIALDLHRQSYGHLALSVLFWIAVGTVISERKNTREPKNKLTLGTDLPSLIGGSTMLLGLMIAVLLKPNNSKLLGLYPFIAFLGLALAASGVWYVRQYRQEMLSLFLFGLPQFISLHTFNIAPLTARVSTLWLWYLGFPVQLHGIMIALPGGGVNVVAECSGLNLMLYMLGVSIVFLMLFPTTKQKQVLLLLMAVGLGFFLNSIRVAFLAYLSATTDKMAFEYWHSENGAIFVVLLTVVLFGLLCWLILGRKSSSSR